MGTRHRRWKDRTDPVICRLRSGSTATVRFLGEPLRPATAQHRNIAKHLLARDAHSDPGAQPRLLDSSFAASRASPGDPAVMNLSYHICQSGIYCRELTPSAFWRAPESMGELRSKLDPADCNYWHPVLLPPPNPAPGDAGLGYAYCPAR